jgi:pentatricopeptide repeat protein
MDVRNPSSTVGTPEPAAAERLDSWKEIAAYLKRDESTVRRWEAEGLPVHRHPHRKKATVYAYKSELDAWRHSGSTGVESRATTAPQAVTSTRRRKAAIVAIGVAVTLIAALALRGPLFRLLDAGHISSIVVLPLKNVSGDPAEDFFADGMTEAVITELGKISALRVLSHQTADTYRQSTKSIPEIARELNVEAVLEGTVLVSGNRVRITANLVRANPERHVWADSYEFDPHDVLMVQAEVARAVAKEIQITVTPEEQARLTHSRRVDPEAYKAYQLGRAYALKRPRRINVAKAAEYFRSAIDKDQSYAPAYAAMAELVLVAGAFPNLDTHQARAEARRWATAALKLDDSLAAAHNALARVAQREWDWKGAEREYLRAIELEPNYSLAHVWYATYLYALQRFDEAIVQAARAQLADPASPTINTWAAAAYFFGGRTEEGMKSLQKVFDLDPGHSDASIVLARTYLSQTKYPEAIRELERSLAMQKEREPLTLGALANAYARGGRREEAVKLVEELKRSGESVNSFAVVWAYAGLADNDQAFVWLERACSERRDRLAWLNVDSLLDPLRSDPRFAEIVHRIGLPTTDYAR